MSIPLECFDNFSNQMISVWFLTRGFNRCVKLLITQCLEGFKCDCVHLNPQKIIVKNRVMRKIAIFCKDVLLTAVRGSSILTSDGCVG